jgi:hypothetical protein
MRSAYALAALLLALSAAILFDLTPAHASTGPIPLNCDRACLENLVNQYLAAVVAHDPKRLPLSQDVRYTENDQLIEIGDGFWKTAEAIGNYKHYFADPEFGQVAFMGTMREAGAPLLLSLRLRVELGRITEVESIYYRQGGGGPSGIADMDKPYEPEDFWFKSIPASQRMSRQELIAVADGYFTGLERNDGKGINGTGTYPFTNDCHRIENGAPTTNVPRRPIARRDQRVLDGLLVAVQTRILLRGAEHPSPPLPCGRRRAGHRVDPRRLRSRHRERRRPLRRPQVRLQGLQPAFQHPGNGGIFDRKLQDPPRGDDRPVGDLSFELWLAGGAQRALAGTSGSVNSNAIVAQLVAPAEAN